MITRKAICSWLRHESKQSKETLEITEDAVSFSFGELRDTLKTSNKYVPYKKLEKKNTHIETSIFVSFFHLSDEMLQPNEKSEKRRTKT